MSDTLRIVWSSIYRAEWDETPGQYVAQGIVAWGRSRRLARCEDATIGFKAYLGVQHYDPARWYGNGEPVAKFFLSIFLHNQTLTLQTFPTLPQALAALHEYHRRLAEA
jgi:hypothetical protein